MRKLLSVAIFFLSLNSYGAPLMVLTSPSHEAQGLPFSVAVVAGGLIFVSGQIAAKPGSLELVSGGMEIKRTKSWRT